MIRFIIFLLSLSLILPSSVFAWGSATHAYIIKQICDSGYDIQSIYGSVVPDFFNLEYDSPYHDYLIKATHYNLEKIKKESKKKNLGSFALGYISHNEKWGADKTAHKKAISIRKSEGYVVEKEKILSPVITFELSDFFKNQGLSNPFILANSISKEITHPLIESAVDLKISSQGDQFIGNELVFSSINRSNIIPDILVTVYANELSKKYKIPVTEASNLIKESEYNFQMSMIRYGEILNNEIDSAIIQLAEEISKIINSYISLRYSDKYFVTEEIIKRFLLLIIEEVQDDYSKEITATIKYLKKNKTIKQYCKKIAK